MKTLLAIGAVSAGASLVAIAAAAWGPVPSAPPISQIADPCAAGTKPIAVEAILLDRDANESPTTRLQKENIEAYIQGLIKDAEPGTIVAIYQLTDNITEPVIKHGAFCRPSSQTNPIWDAHNAAAKRLAQGYLNPLAQARDAAMVERQNNWTPLAEGIAAISTDSDFHGDKPSVPKRLHIFSDMIVNVEGKCRGFSTGITTKSCRAYAKDTPAQLDNTTVFVRVLKRTLENSKVKQSDALQSFWTDYARANGVLNVDWKLLR